MGKRSIRIERRALKHLGSESGTEDFCNLQIFCILQKFRQISVQISVCILQKNSVIYRRFLYFTEIEAEMRQKSVFCFNGLY